MTDAIGRRRGAAPIRRCHHERTQVTLGCMTWEAPFDQELWEHQGQALTVRELVLRLADAPDPDARVLVGVYDGSSVVLRQPVDLSAETNGAEWRVVLTGGQLIAE